jgi:hypothetical protein
LWAIASGEKFWTGEYRYRRANNTYAHVVDPRLHVAHRTFRNQESVEIASYGHLISVKYPSIEGW